MKRFLPALLLMFSATNASSWEYRESIDEMDDKSTYSIYKINNQKKAMLLVICEDSSRTDIVLSTKTYLQTGKDLLVFRFDNKESFNVDSSYVDKDAFIFDRDINKKIIEGMKASNVLKIKYYNYESSKVAKFNLVGFTKQFNRIQNKCRGVK